MDITEILRNRREVNITAYCAKPRRYSPADPSGKEGRFSGDGTKAYYKADSLEAAWREVTSHNPEANPDDYRFFQSHLQARVVDIGPFAGTEYVRPKAEGGWEPTRKLSDAFQANGVVGFQYPSSPAVRQGQPGTCFCIYKFAREFTEKEFREVTWKP